MKKIIIAESQARKMVKRIVEDKFNQKSDSSNSSQLNLISIINQENGKKII
jgi:hypothetical protein